MQLKLASDFLVEGLSHHIVNRHPLKIKILPVETFPPQMLYKDAVGPLFRHLTFNSDQWRGDLIAGSLQKAGSNSFF